MDRGGGGGGGGGRGGAGIVPPASPNPPNPPTPMSGESAPPISPQTPAKPEDNPADEGGTTTTTAARAGFAARTGHASAASGAGTGTDLDPAIEYNMDLFPELKGQYKIVGSIGKGTFSVVYKAESLDGEDVWAIKRIHRLSKPSRIVNEIDCLKELGGNGHVVEVDAILNDGEYTSLVLPYFEHRHFKVRPSHANILIC